jgi:hypothetical protein
VSAIEYADGYQPEWDIALHTGRLGERAVGQVLAHDGDDVVLIEVKDEHRSRSHIFVEHESRGRPSFLAVTRATWAAILAPGGVIVFIPTDHLRALHALALERLGPRRSGDGNTGAIVPKRWLLGDMEDSR